MSRVRGRIMRLQGVGVVQGGSVEGVAWDGSGGTPRGRFLQRHATTIVIAGPSSAASSVRAAAQRLVFEGHVPDAVGASRAKGGKGQA